MCLVDGVQWCVTVFSVRAERIDRVPHIEIRSGKRSVCVTTMQSDDLFFTLHSRAIEGNHHCVCMCDCMRVHKASEHSQLCVRGMDSVHVFELIGCVGNIR